NPMAPGDLGATALAPVQEAVKDELVDTRGVRVSYSFPVEDPTALEAGPVTEPFKAESNWYWLRVTSEQLNQGVELPVSQTGALVRIDMVAGSPEDGGKGGLNPTDLVLVSESGESFGEGSGMDMLVTPEQ